MRCAGIEAEAASLRHRHLDAAVHGADVDRFRDRPRGREAHAAALGLDVEAALEAVDDDVVPGRADQSALLEPLGLETAVHHAHFDGAGDPRQLDVVVARLRVYGAGDVRGADLAVPGDEPDVSADTLDLDVLVSGLEIGRAHV